MSAPTLGDFFPGVDIDAARADAEQGATIEGRKARAASREDPDAYARTRRIALESGLQPITAKGIEPRLEQQNRERKVTEWMERVDNPRSRRWFTSSDDYAALAHDQLDNMSAAEKHFQSFAPLMPVSEPEDVAEAWSIFRLPGALIDRAIGGDKQVDVNLATATELLAEMGMDIPLTPEHIAKRASDRAERDRRFASSEEFNEGLTFVPIAVAEQGSQIIRGQTRFWKSHLTAQAAIGMALKANPSTRLGALAITAAQGARRLRVPDAAGQLAVYKFSIMQEMGAMKEESLDAFPVTPELPADSPARNVPILVMGVLAGGAEGFSQLQITKGLRGLGGAGDIVRKRFAAMLRDPRQMAAMKEIFGSAAVEFSTEGLQEFYAIVAGEWTGALDAVLKEPIDAEGSKNRPQLFERVLDRMMEVETWQRIWDAALTGAVVGGATSTAGVTVQRGLERVGEAMDEHRRNTHPEEVRVFFDGAKRVTSDLAKLKERSNPALQDFIESVNENGIESVRIDAEALNVMFQSGALDEETFFNEMVPAEDRESVREGYAAALLGENGGDVELSVGSYVANVMDTEFHDTLLPHIRLDADGITEAEQIEESKGAEERAAATVARAEAQRARIDERKQQVDFIAKSLALDIGAATPQLNQRDTRLQARINADVIVRLAERAGMEPQALADKVGRLVVVGDAEPAQAGSFLQTPFQGIQDELDALHPEAKSFVQETTSGELNLSDLKVAKGNRKKGIGSAFMESLVSIADREGLTITLTPGSRDDKHGTTSRKRLVKFYKRFGFVENKGRNKDFRRTAGSMFREPQGSVTGLGQELYQPEGDGTGAPRGSFTPGVNGAPSVIRLGPTANLSTFLHESLGHYTTHVLETLAADPSAPAQIREDWETLRKYVGLKEGEAIVDQAELATAMSALSAARQSDDAKALRTAEGLVNKANRRLEKLARAMEQYLREGKAPSKELRGAFRRMAAWLRDVYDDIKRLTGQPLPQDVVDVFDRFFASDADIEAAKGQVGGGRLFDERPQQGMTEAEWAKYEAQALSRDHAMRERMVQKKAREEKRRLTAEFLSDRAELKTIVEAKLRTDRQHQVRQWLANGEWIDPDSQAPIQEHEKLDQNLIEQDFGVETARNLPRYKNGVLAGKKAGGLDYQDVAAAFGLDPREMIEGLLTTQTLDDAVEANTDALIADQVPSSIDALESALDSIHEVEEEAARVVTEMRVLKQLREIGPVAEAARRTVADEGAGTASERSEGVASAEAEVESAQAALAEVSEVGDDQSIAAARLRVSNALAGLAGAQARRSAATPLRRAERVRRRASASIRVDQKAIRQAAEAYVARIPIGELKPNKFASAERKAMRKARMADPLRNPEIALRAMEDYLFNHFAYRAAKEAQGRVTTIRARVGRMMKPKHLAKVEGGNAEVKDHIVWMAVASQLVNRRQIPKEATSPLSVEEQAIAQFERRQDVRPVGQNRVVRKPKGTLQKLTEDLELAGNEMAFDHAVVSEALSTGDYRFMSRAEVEEVSRALTQLDKIAYDENKVRLGDIEYSISELREAMIARAYESRDARPSAPGEGEIVSHDDRSARRRASDFKMRGLAWMLKPETMAWDLDGGKELGPNQQWLGQAARDAQFKENQIKDRVGKGMHDIFTAAFTKKEMREFTTREYNVPEVRRAFTMEQFLAIVLNLGNDYNRAALQDGFAFYERSLGALTDEQLNAVLNAMPGRDRMVDVAEAIGSLIDSLKDEAFEVHRRVTGQRVEAVEVQPFQMPWGRTMKGFYYPLARDPKTNLKGQEQDEKQTTAELYGLQRGLSQTRHQHLTARKNFGDNAVNLKLGPLYQHLNQVAHDIAQREFVITNHKILHHKDFIKMAQDLGREDWLRSLWKWNESIAGASVVDDPLSSWAARRRTAASVAILGFSMSTVAIQPFAIADGATRTGWANIGRAARGLLEDRKGMVEFAWQNSQAIPFRATSWDREISSLNARLSPSQRKDAWNRWGMFPIAWLDMQAATLVWHAAYIQGLNELEESRGDSEKAIQYADRITELTQAAAQPKDLARVMSHPNELVKGLTIFGSFMNARFNNVYELAVKTHEFKDMSKFEFYNRMIALMFIQPLLVQIARISWPEEGEDVPAWAGWSVLGEILGMFPLVGDVVGALAYGFGVEMHPAGRVSEQALNTVKKASKLAIGGGDAMDVLDVAGDIAVSTMMFTGVAGASQVNRELQALEAIINGELEVEEIAPAVLFGPNRKRN